MEMLATDLVPVRMSDCRCPGTPHEDGDIAYLRPFLLYAGGAEALRMMAKADGDPAMLGELVGPVYIKHGVAGWNKVDADGVPVPVTPETLALLRYEDAYELANKADDLYGDSVLAPLVKRIATFSAGGQTTGSTSRNSRSSSRRREPSQRSSPKPSEASTPSDG